MPEAFSNDSCDQLPSSWKALSKDKLFISGTLKSDVIANQRQGGSALGFGWVIGVFVEDGKS